MDDQLDTPSGEETPETAGKDVDRQAEEDATGGGGTLGAEHPEDAPVGGATEGADDTANVQAVPAGWYPDPRQPGSGRQRYWDGSGWTDKISAQGQAATALPAPAVSSERKTPDERRALLAQQIQFAAGRGRRIESQSDYQAVLVAGQPVNHTLHAILTIFTCLLWGIVWAIIAGTGGEKREMVVVDEFGNVQYTALGKA